MNQTFPLLHIESLKAVYSNGEGGFSLQVLQDVQLDVQQGETVAIVGPSGSGKSTLLNMIGALDSPASGKIYLDNQDLSQLNEQELALVRNQKIGFIFQDHHLLPQCSVLENVLLPTLVRAASAGSESVDEARRLLGRVGLSERLEHKPAQLSGGERQRVAYVRSLINQPVLLLADEPTGSLDHENANQLMSLLLEINHDRGLTSIVVTHALELVKNMDRVFELRDGHLREIGEMP